MPVGVAPVVGALRGEPVVDGLDEPGVVGEVGDLSAVLKGRVHDVDVVGSVRERLQARHVGAVDAGRVGEVAALETLGFLAEVVADEGDLVAIRRVPDDDLLHTAGISVLEDVDRAFQVERHHLGAALGDLSLAASVSRLLGTAGRDQQEGDDGERAQ